MVVLVVLTCVKQYSITLCQTLLDYPVSNTTQLQLKLVEVLSTLTANKN